MIQTKNIKRNLDRNRRVLSIEIEYNGSIEDPADILLLFGEWLWKEFTSMKIEPVEAMRSIDAAMKGFH